jgi:lipopolysaccharide transport system permease protein
MTAPASTVSTSGATIELPQRPGESGHRSAHLVDAAQTVTVVEPPTGWVRLELGEVWRYRDLLFMLVWRDLSARYRQSIVGYGWTIARPVLTALIFTLVFAVFVKVQTDIPYPLFAFAALIPWGYFSNALATVTGSVVSGSNLLTKVYFPRLILPLSAVVSGLVEVAIQLGVLAVLLAVYRVVPGWQITLLPVFLAASVITVAAFGIWLTALNVRYRDVGLMVPFVLQVWMYLCPVAYPISVVPQEYRFWYSLNPMVGVIEGFRWCVLNTPAPEAGTFIASTVMMLLILVGGLLYFRRLESTFADII